MPRVMRTTLWVARAGGLVALVAAITAISVDQPAPATALVQSRPAIDQRSVRGAASSPSRRLQVIVHKPSVSTSTDPSAASRVPNDPLYSGSWALQAIGAAQAWKLTVGDPSIVVAVLDTGVAATHPDLQGAVLPGIDIVNRDDAPDDDFGHGTLVSGLIAARGDNALGGAGVCWRCSVLPVKVIGADGRGTVSDVADGIRYAVARGARVINLSFVLSADDPGVAAAVADAVTHGVVVVAAAGNSASSAPVYPAAYPGVIAVGATDQADTLFPWSGTGPWVTVDAPGCGTATSASGSYETSCGTSAATAIVSGIVGLALSAHPAATASTIAQALVSSARPIAGTTAGRIDAAAALRALALA